MIPEPLLPEPKPDCEDGVELQPVEPVPGVPSGNNVVITPFTAGSAGAAHTSQES